MSDRPLPRPGLRAAALLLAALALGGCASTIRLDNEVRSYAAWQPTAVGEPAPLPAWGDLYRFERRPSQAQGQAAQEQQALEGLAREALAKVGLQAMPDAAPGRPLALRWTVEVAAHSALLLRSPWDYPYRPGVAIGVGVGHVTRHGMVGLNAPLYPPPSPPWYRRELTLTLRDARNGQLVYETTASHDGPWADSPRLWSALLDAALQGFPQPPAGTRRVVIELAR
ncbi:MAG: hypothetical protein RJA36_493 [Pseudomonadota bacterium]|jgi:hypothetical protein